MDEKLKMKPRSGHFSKTAQKRKHDYCIKFP